MPRELKRPAPTDYLAAVAGRFHPERVPVWDWERRLWVWRGPDGSEAELGADWHQAQVALVRLGHRVRCPHGAALSGAPCPSCREHIAGQLAASRS